MTLEEHFIVYPEGDTQEISHRLRFNQVVDLNGNPLRIPLPTVKMIAYRVYKITREENRGENISFYHLSLLHRDELLELV
jgi:hypothetical protein